MPAKYIDINILSPQSPNDYKIGVPGSARVTFGGYRLGNPVGVSSASTVSTTGVTITQLDYGTQTTTDLVNETKYYWNSGDAIPAGTYRVEYVSGWWRPYTGNSNHCVQHSYAPVGPFIKYNNGASSLRAPGIVGDYSTSAACEAANAGSYANFTHTGGTISVYLYDTDHSLNDGPGITVRLRRIP